MNVTLSQVIVAAGIGYLLGCIQTAYLLGRLIGKIDIRQHGSGNAGASNATTTLGWKYGIITALVDVFKGTAAVLVAKAIYPGLPEPAYIAGIAAILGHMFPFYMKFRGGKGVAALVGMMLGLDWKLGILFILLVAIPALITDYIVSGSFTTFTALPIVTIVRGYPLPYIIVAVCLTALCYYKHRENIRRIINKKEVRISSVVKGRHH
ncbi:MAG: glycerol-3-phosphate 1-O-acyltransferase PlsY [Anaerolineae bacterium]|nr:glycerol-3-phosphate 1-O-acyltransferase PlsY [Anaerolineae bacterium]